MEVFPRKALMIILVLSVAAAAEAGEGVRVVANGASPSQTIRHWHLQENWRTGGGDAGPLFGRIVDAAIDSAGNIYVLDYQQRVTFVFDPQGKWTGRRGGLGEGPGETTKASDLLVGPGRLGLVNRFPARIVWLDAEGDPMGATTPHSGPNDDGFLGCWSAVLRNGDLVMALTSSTFAESRTISRHFLAGVGADGSTGPVFHEWPVDAYLQGSRDGVVDEGRYYNPLVRSWDQDPLGRIWIARDRDSYRLDVIDPDGRVVLTVTREMTPPFRGERAKARIRRSIGRQWDDSGLPIVVGDRAPCVTGLWIEEHPWQTEVWVETAASHHDLPPGVMVRYDIFDLAGNFTHQVDIEGPGDPLFDRWHLTGDNGLIVIRNASDGGFGDDDPDNPRRDDAELEVISYRILWEE